MKYDTATPYTAAYVILRDGDKVAFVLRANIGYMNGYYGLPSGKVEKAESFSAAAVREGLEEVGIIIKPTDLHHALTSHRTAPDSDWVDVYFEVVAWQGEVTNAEPHMHSEVAWLDIHDLPDNVIPSVRDALMQIAAGAKYIEQGWDGRAN